MELCVGLPLLSETTNAENSQSYAVIIRCFPHSLLFGRKANNGLRREQICLIVNKILGLPANKPAPV